MANTLTPIMHKILARGLATLRQECVMPRLVNSSYSMDAAKRGDTIDIPVPTSVGVRNVTPSNTPVAPTDGSQNLEQVPLNRWRQNDPIYLTDKEMVEIDKSEHFLPMQMSEAVKALANDVNTYLYSKYTRIYGYAGDVTTAPFAGAGRLGVEDSTKAVKELDDQLCPGTDRRAVIGTDAKSEFLSLGEFADIDKIGNSDAKIRGELGQRHGLNYFWDQDIPTHTAGTANDDVETDVVAVDNGGGYAADANAQSSTITIDVDAGTSTLVAGDIIKFAGHDQKYVVKTGGTLDTVGVAITIEPGLQASIADDEDIEVPLNTHKVHLAFHRDAWAFGMRPLVQETQEFASLQGNITQMQDPQTGLIMRLEVTRQHKQVVWEFDMLYGAELVRPALAARIVGAP